MDTETTTQTTTNVTVDSIRDKWVVNLSSIPLIKAQEMLLARGPNFVVEPKCPPKEEYIVTVEEACLKLPPRWQQN